MLPRLKILFEDEHILVCVKPAGMPCESDRSGAPDLLNIVKSHLLGSYAALLHRLDRPVGGVMVFAKNKSAAAALSLDIKKHSQGIDGFFEKEYLAVLTERTYKGDTKNQAGKITQADTQKQAGRITQADMQKQAGKITQVGSSWHDLSDYIAKDTKTNSSFITTKEDSRGKLAVLSYYIENKREISLPGLLGSDISPSGGTLTLLLVRIRLKTGRHHQIRVQMQEHLGGIWGDKKYNPLFQPRLDYKKIQAEFNNPDCRVGELALFSSTLGFLHPVTKEKLRFEASPSNSVFPFFLP